MAIDFAAAVANKNELDKAADEIQTIRLQLERTREAYKSGWRSPEIYDMESAIDRTLRRLDDIEKELKETGHCILKNAEDIRREEEEARRREAEARRQAEENSRRQAEEAARRNEENSRRQAEESRQQSAQTVEAPASNNENTSSSNSSGGFVSTMVNIWKSIFR